MKWSLIFWYFSYKYGFIVAPFSYLITIISISVIVDTAGGDMALTGLLIFLSGIGYILLIPVLMKNVNIRDKRVEEGLMLKKFRR